MPRKVLIIDDDVDVAEVVATTLQGAGFTVRTQPGGETGIRCAQEWNPDVIICDLNMPLVTGSTVRQALANDEETQNIPIVFMSGSDEPPGLVGPRRWFLHKPFSPERLVANVHEALAAR
jgi:CheY-like chemotaxis protein